MTPNFPFLSLSSPVLVLLVILSSQTAPAQITVQLYDYSEVSASGLAAALQSAGTALRNAGIEVRWQTCRVGGATAGRSRCSFNPNDATHFLLSILPEKMSAKISPRSKQLGLSAINDADGFPVNAHIFHDRILNFSNQHSLPWTLVFGDVVTHELGHLLLGTASHSARGIMQATWRPADLMQGAFGFTAQQAESMRRNIQRRSLQSELLAGPSQSALR